MACPTGHADELKCPLCRDDPTAGIPTIDAVDDDVEGGELRAFAIEVAMTDDDHVIIPKHQFEKLMWMTTFNSAVLDAWQRRFPEAVDEVAKDANRRLGQGGLDER